MIIIANRQAVAKTRKSYLLIKINLRPISERNALRKRKYSCFLFVFKRRIFRRKRKYALNILKIITITSNLHQANTFTLKPSSVTTIMQNSLQSNHNNSIDLHCKVCVRLKQYQRDTNTFANE